jgi:hypothetical protein
MTVRSEIAANGYAFLPSLDQNRTTEEVVSSLGVIGARGETAPVHLLKPTLAESSTPNTYSGMYGHGQFPFHTDLAHWPYPPRFLLLRCLIGYPAIPTMLLDGARLVEIIGSAALSRSLVQPRRPLRGSLPLLRLYDSQRGDHGLFRWDEVFIRPASTAGRAGFDKVRQEVSHAQPTKISLVSRGDTLILDNWRMLHARSPVPSECQDRAIERAYLEEVF